MTNFPVYRVKSRYSKGKHFTQWMSMRNGEIVFNNDFDDADHFSSYAEAEKCAELTKIDINTGAAHPENFCVVIEEKVPALTGWDDYLGFEVWEECRFDISAVVTTLELL